MKKKYFAPLLLLSIVPFLSSCASQQEVNNLNYHIRTLNKKIEDLKGDPTVDQMQKRQANSSSLMDQLQADILQLQGQLEENAHTNRMLHEQNKELEQAVVSLQTEQEQKLNSKLTELNNKISMQENSLATIRQARIDDAKRRSKAAAEAAEEAMRKANAASAAQKSASQVQPTQHIRVTATKVVNAGALKSAAVEAPDPIAKPTPVVSTPSKPEVAVEVEDTPAPTKPASANGNYFTQGQEQFSKKQYKKAYTLFAKHTENSNSQDETISARYMMGECLFEQGQYDQAIIQYQQIISSFPGNPQAAKALLKQGESFEQLSDSDTAKIIYKKITASYGSTPEAEIAKKRIQSL